MLWLNDRPWKRKWWFTGSETRSPKCQIPNGQEVQNSEAAATEPRFDSCRSRDLQSSGLLLRALIDMRPLPILIQFLQSSRNDHALHNFNLFRHRILLPLRPPCYIQHHRDSRSNPATLFRRAGQLLAVTV